MMWGRGYYGGSDGWVGIGLLMLFGFLVLVGIVLLIIWLVRELSGSRGGRDWDRSQGRPQPGPPYGYGQAGGYGQPGYGQPAQPGGYGPQDRPGSYGVVRERRMEDDPAVIVARERYARGEIDSDEFATLLRNLGYGPKGPRTESEPGERR